MAAPAPNAPVPTMRASRTGPEAYFRWRVERARAFLGSVGDGATRRGQRVLDTGCGQGPLAKLLSDEGARVAAVDVSEALLREMRGFLAGARIGIARARNEALPFPDATFDAVMSFDVLEHVADPDLAIAEAARCLAPGGRMLLEMTPYWALASGHHLYDYTHVPVQLVPERLTRWLVRRRAPDPERAERDLAQFRALNRISVARARRLFRKHGLRRDREHFIFKYPDVFEWRIDWVRFLGPLKELLPMSYQAALTKVPR